MQLRAALRAARVQKFRSARDFAVKAGLSHSTVAKIENVNRKNAKDYDPGVIVVSRYLRPLGVSLANFLLQIERQTDADATAPTQSAITPPTEHGGPSRTVPAGAIDRDRVAEEALEDITLRLIDALTELSAARRQAAGTSPSRTGRVSGDRKSRR